MSTDKNIIIPLIGLDGSGKSSLIARIKSDPSDPRPTIGFQPFNCQLRYDQQQQQQSITLYDLGGGPKIRGIWKNYFAECHCLIFVIDLQSVLVSPQPAQVRPQTAANNNGTTVNTLKQLFEEIIGQHSFVRGKPLLLLLNNKSPQSSTTSANARLDKIKRLLEDTLALGSIVPTEEWLYLQECGGETMQSLRNRIESNKTPVRIIIQECSLKGLFSANNMPDISMDFHQLQIIPVDERAQQQKQQPPRRVGNSNKVEPISRPATAAAVDTANNVSDALTSIDPRLKRALWVLMAAVQSRRGELEERIKQDSLEQRRLYAQERYDRKRQLNLLQQQERQQKTAGI